MCVKHVSKVTNTNAFKMHRRIQDFVRGGGQGLLDPPGGGGQGPLGPPGSAPDYLGEQFFVETGGAKAPLAPPGSAPEMSA